MVPGRKGHKRYTRAKNLREGVGGYLFQGRFGSCVLDEQHLLAAVRYTELNPVSAGIVRAPGEYVWSSARFHLGRRKADGLVRQGDRDLLGLVDDWRAFLRDGVEEMEARELERHVSSGRPWDSERFVRRLERPLWPRKGGWPKGKRRGKRKRCARSGRGLVASR